jgi:cellulose synthase/poly-beta-1,6-N-acetylglucosamine synthase-like glycosyltransferase
MFSNLLLLAFQPPPEFNFDPNAPGPGGAGIAGALCSGVGGLICMAVFAALLIIPLIGMWKLFEKAGKPGWAAIIPFYNLYVLTEIAGMDVMWFILLLVPCVQYVAIFVVMINVAKNFGKDTTYGVLMALFAFIFVPMLGFSNARYTPMKH